MVFLESDRSKLQAGPKYTYTSFAYFVMHSIGITFSYLLMIQNRNFKILKELFSYKTALSVVIDLEKSWTV
jgi:hypothetical protein